LKISNGRVRQRLKYNLPTIIAYLPTDFSNLSALISNPPTENYLIFAEKSYLPTQ